MNQIVWNKYAKIDYYKNIDYLLEAWSEKIAQNFIDDVKHVILLLKQDTITFRETNLPGVYCCVINKHITLFYRHKQENIIELLRFWNNNSDRDNLQV
jgi:plasmid stabilization system protein ParE